MDTFLIGNINGAIVLDERRPKIKEELDKKGKKVNVYYFPVKARITYKGERYYISLGFDLIEDKFNDIFGWALDENTLKKKRVEKNIKSKENKSIYNLIAAQFERIKKTVEEIHQTQEYSHETLRNKLSKGRRAYLDAAFENKIAELNRKGQAGTAVGYQTALNCFNRYKSNVRFVDITPQWLENFECWALNDSRTSKETKNKKKHKGINETSISIYLRCLRTLFNEAIRCGDVPKAAYPFYSKETKGYRIPKGSGTKIALTIEQMQRIAALELEKGSSLERCRDIFLLSFQLGGINIKDLLLLKWKYIVNNEVHFVREKTKNTVHEKKSIIIPFTDTAKRILESQGNSDKSPDAYVIPFLTDGLTPQKQRKNIMSYTKQVNKQLKRIGKKEGIEIEGLSTMVSRHSFATILKNSGAPIAFIGETLGHTSTKTTESYLKSFESDQRKKQFEVISNIG